MLGVLRVLEVMEVLEVLEVGAGVEVEVRAALQDSVYLILVEAEAAEAAQLLERGAFLVNRELQGLLVAPGVLPLVERVERALTAALVV